MAINLLKTLLLSFLMMLAVTSWCQVTGNFSASKFVGNYDVEKVRSSINVFSLYSIDSKAVKTVATAEETSFLNIDFAGERFAGITLQANDTRSDDYKLLVSGTNGMIELPRPANITYQGFTDDGGQVVLTIDEFFISGIITLGGERFYIEPAFRFDPNIEKDTYILYKSEDVVPFKGNSCIMMRTEEQHDEILDVVQEEVFRNPPTGCVTVRLAIAADASMHTRYGTVALVNAQTAAVMALVNTDYSTVFDRQIIFSTVANLVSTNPASCPESGWSTSTDPTVLLPAFRTWGNSTGCSQFGVTFDLAQLWTNRDFDGSTVGLAYTPGVCGSFKYHILQDFLPATMSELRCMTSHEIGHNFNSGHDNFGDPYIMAPVVSSSTSWSSTSVSTINTHETSSSCVTGTFALLGSPIARFFLPSQWCLNSSITLTDKSYRTPTTWTWSMPGGTPSSANTQNSTVSYSTGGTKTIDLAVSNGSCGGSSSNVAKSLTILPSSYPSGHCTTANTNTGTGGNFGMGIFNVTLNSLNSSTNGTNPDGAFSDSTCNLVATLSAASNTINITVGTTNAQQIQAWIDFNNDGTFSTPSERIANSISGVNGLQSFNFTIPNLPPPNATVTNTLLKMRVMDDFVGAATPTPCVTPTYGQSENYGIIILPSALPIELASFEAKRSDKGALLHWLTNSETNNSYFNVERSHDGIRFEHIGKVNGAGTSLQSLNYHFLDATPWPGINYYRLAQVDFDGSSTYSNIVQVVFDEKESDLQAIVAPNPMRDGIIKFRLFSENETNFLAETFDLTGRLVLAKNFDAKAGWNDFHWLSDGFPSGQFLLVLKNTTSARVIKIQH